MLCKHSDYGRSQCKPNLTKPISTRPIKSSTQYFIKLSVSSAISHKLALFSLIHSYAKAKATTVEPVLSLDGGAVDGGYFYELIFFG